MGLINKMEEESECIEVIFKNYIENKNKKNLFIFFEGKDDFRYYSSRIFSYFSKKNYSQHHCNSKENVINLYRMIKNQTKSKNRKNLYFVDKDYNEEKIEEDIYVTPCYSIENFYLSDSAIEDSIKGIFGFSDEQLDCTDDFENACNFIKNKRNQIIDEIIYGNAIYSLQIKKCTSSQNPPNLKALREYENIKDKTCIEDFKVIVKNFIEITEKEIKKEMDNLREKTSENIRGKYFIKEILFSMFSL